MRISVVICTFNRVKNLPSALNSLKSQVFKEFEVIVVNGPSNDGTNELLASYGDSITVLTTSQRNLSISRNIGIAHSHGDIVAFLDDDAIADPNWLNELVVPYANPCVGGVGGLVYDHTGGKLQYRYSACYRRGESLFTVYPPFDNLVVKGADPFLYIQGTNCSFRRDVLEKIGGFNEDIEYYHDETDVCMRVIDIGFKIESLNCASVIHKYAESHIRSIKKIVFDPYTTVKNQHLFAIQNGVSSQPLSQIFSSLGYYTNRVREGARWHFKQNDFSFEQLQFFMRRVDEGVASGVKGGFSDRNSRNFGTLPAAEGFKRYQSHSDFVPLNIVYISQELPPATIGGIGRFTLDLARAMVRKGHIVHIITRGDINSIEYDRGLYIHRIEYSTPSEEALQITPLAWSLAHLFSVYKYLLKISERFQVDIVSGPIWLAEPLFCSLSQRWPTVLTLHTTMKTICDLHPNEASRPESTGLIKLESLAFRSANLIQSNSEAVLVKSINDYGNRGNVVVIPHGIESIEEPIAPRKKTLHESMRVLFVGRLELRKGVDILLSAITKIFPINNTGKWPNIEFILAGPYSLNAVDGLNFPDWFSRERNDLVRSGKVKFLGEISDAEIKNEYAIADLFVLPSRFESFGLVILEAMRFGVPVLSTDSSGMREVVKEEYGGLFPPENPAALAQKIISLYADPMLRDKMSQNAINAINTVFSIEKIADRAVQAYNSIRNDFVGSSERKHGNEGVEFVAHLAPILGISIEDTMAIVSELNSPVTPQSRIRHLLDALSHDNDRDFHNKCYRIILGRNYEGVDSSDSSSVDICIPGTRADYISTMFESAEAKSSPFSMELYSAWRKFVS